MQRSPFPSLRPRNSDAQRCGQRWSITPTRPSPSRNAISFSPSSIRRSGAPPRTTSEDISAGIQYSRINWPMTVPGPTRVNSTLSLAVVMPSSRCLQRPCGRPRAALRRCYIGLGGAGRADEAALAHTLLALPALNLIKRNAAAHCLMCHDAQATGTLLQANIVKRHIDQDMTAHVTNQTAAVEI